MKIKTKSYEICNSTNPKHLNIKIKITKITKKLAICKIIKSGRNYKLKLTKSKNIWQGTFHNKYVWTFEKTKKRSSNGNDNNKIYNKYIFYTFVNNNKPGPGPDAGTAGNTSGG